jgi:hypothetical protein
LGTSEKNATSDAEVSADANNSRIIIIKPVSTSSEFPDTSMLSRFMERLIKWCESVISKLIVELVDAAKVREK